MKNNREDRRSCHNISFVLGLAVLGRHPYRDQVAVHAFDLMMALVTPVRGQKSN